MAARARVQSKGPASKSGPGEKRPSRRRCRECDRPGTADDPLSRRNLHASCGQARMVAAITLQRDKDNPAWELWEARRKAGLLNYLRQVEAAQG